MSDPLMIDVALRVLFAQLCLFVLCALICRVRIMRSDVDGIASWASAALMAAFALGSLVDVLGGASIPRASVFGLLGEALYLCHSWAIKRFGHARTRARAEKDKAAIS